jgi:hypothetical protein
MILDVTIGKREVYWQGRMGIGHKKSAVKAALKKSSKEAILMMAFLHAFLDAVNRGDDYGRKIRKNPDDPDEALHRTVQHVPKKLTQHDSLLVTCPRNSYVELFTTIS